MILDNIFEKLGNIRRLYVSGFYYQDRPSSYGMTCINQREIEKTQLVHLGIISRQGWSWDRVIKEPMDEIEIANQITDGKRPSLDKFCPALAYALRVNRDFLNRLHDVCTLLMLSRFRLGLNKDCVHLILSFLSVKDWDFRQERKRNLTPKSSKWAKNVIYNEGLRREFEQSIQNDKESNETRRAEIVERLNAKEEAIRIVNEGMDELIQSKKKRKL